MIPSHLIQTSPKGKFGWCPGWLMTKGHTEPDLLGTLALYLSSRREVVSLLGVLESPRWPASGPQGSPRWSLPMNWSHWWGTSTDFARKDFQSAEEQEAWRSLLQVKPHLPVLARYNPFPSPHRHFFLKTSREGNFTTS